MRLEVDLDGNITEHEDAPIAEISKEELEKQRISLIKRKSGDIIESQYPIYKQLNITNLLDGYTQKDKDEMIEFINKIRNISNKAEQEGTALEDINWLL